MLNTSLISAMKHFNETGGIDRTVLLPAEQPYSISSHPHEGLAAFQIALVSVMARTCRHSIDQIRVCFEIARAFQFLRHDIVNNHPFWQEQARYNGEAVTNSLMIFNQDIANMSGHLTVAIEGFQESPQRTQEGQARLIALVTNMEGLAQEGAVEAKRTEYFSLRAQQGFPYFEPQECPILPEGQDAEAYTKNIYMQSVTSLEELVSAQEDCIRTMLARAAYIQEVVLPRASAVDAPSWQEDLNDNRGYMPALESRLQVINRMEERAAAFVALRFQR